MNAPRGMYLSSDGQWIALSASTVSTAAPLMALVGRRELAEETWFSSARGRREHADLIDSLIAPWVAGQPADETLRACREAGVPVFPVYSAHDILEDPQYAAIGTIGSFEDSRLGTVRMPNVLGRLSATPGTVEWLGPDLGQHTDEILSSLGLPPEEIARLRANGIA